MIEVVPYGNPMLTVYSRATSGSGDPFALPADASELVLIPAAVTTALTVDLEITLDADATSPVYQKIATSKDIKAVPSVVDVKGYGGLQCRLTSTAFTLGTPTSAIVYAKCSKSQ